MSHSEWRYFFVSARNSSDRAQNLIISTTKQRAAQLTIALRLRINVRRTIEIHCNSKNLSPHTTSRARARMHTRREISADPAKGENDRRQLFQRSMGINHRQNRPFASDGHPRAFVRSSLPHWLDGRVLNGRDRRLADLSQRYLFALSYFYLLLRSLRSHFHSFYIFFCFFRSIHARVFYGMVTRSCGRPRLRAWQPWRTSSFPHREICSNFSLPDATMYLPVPSSSPASSSFHATAPDSRKSVVPLPVLRHGWAPHFVGHDNVFIIHRIIRARVGRNQVGRYYAPLSAASNRWFTGTRIGKKLSARHSGKQRWFQRRDGMELENGRWFIFARRTPLRRARNCAKFIWLMTTMSKCKSSQGPTILINASLNKCGNIKGHLLLYSRITSICAISSKTFRSLNCGTGKRWHLMKLCRSIMRTHRVPNAISPLR